MGTDSLQLLDHALRYADDFGWPVFPCHSIQDGGCTCRKRAGCGSAGKHPHTRAGLKAATTNTRTIKEWWRRWPDANVAVVTGADSDLVVIDVDVKDGGQSSLEVVMGRLEGLPEHPLARTGSGGFHMLFQHPGGCVHNRQGIADGIDVRGDGGYIIAPCSAHVSGGVYRWERDPEDIAPPTLPESWLEWLTARSTSQRHVCALSLHRDTEDILEGAWGEEVVGAPVDEFREFAIQNTLPTGPGQRHDKLFEFSRALYAHPDLAELSFKELKPLVQEWHARALPYIRTKSFFETWADFAESWPKVKYPKGTSPMTAILERAVAADPPAVATQYEQDQVRLLISICYQLQQEAGKRPFYLSARKAGELVGVTPRHALTWLNGLVADEVLKLVRKGGYGSRKANRYQYVADKPNSSTRPKTTGRARSH